MIAFVIIGCGTSSVGISYTILISNIVSMIIRVFEEKENEIIAAKVVSKYSAKLAAERGVQK